MAETDTAPAPPQPEPESLPGPSELDAIALQPGIPVAEQIRVSAEALDRDDLIGLHVEIPYRRLVVADSHVTQKRDFELKKVGRPRYQKWGNIRGFARREAVINESFTDVPHVIVETYDEDGELIAIENHTRDGFYNLLNGPSVTGAAWAAEKEAVITHDTLALDVPNKGVFAGISEQLEAKGITNWNGLTWQRGRLTKKIVKDVPVKEATYDGGHRWARSFIVQTFDEHGTTLGQEIIHDYNLLQVFEKISQENDPQARPIHNLRLERPITQSEWEQRMYGWFGVPMPPDYTAEELKRAEQTALNDLFDRQTAGLPESLTEQERTVAWLLGHADTLPERQSHEQMMRIATAQQDPLWREKSITNRRKEALAAILSKHGLINVLECALKLHADVERAAAKLGLKATPEEASVTWIVETMADRFYYANHPRVGDPDVNGLRLGDAVGDSLKARHIQRDIVDMKLGNMFSRSMIKINPPYIKPIPEVNEQGQPKYEVDQKVVFNDDWFKEFPAMNKAEFQGVAKQSIFRKQIEKLAHQVYDKLTERGEQAAAADFVKLGRMLRRLLAE